MPSSVRYTVLSHTLCKRLFVLVWLLLHTVSSAEANKIALLVGISEYPKIQMAEASWGDIHGANDIMLISSTLKKQGFTVNELHDSKATATNKGDLVYIHFSVHGQPFEDKSGDEDDGWDEAFVPYDAQRIYYKKYKGENHIIDDELERYISNIRTSVGAKGFVYVVLDACHMGGASRDESETETEEYVRGTDLGFSPHHKKYIPKIDRRGHLKVKASPNLSGVCYIEACRSYQTNTEIKENGKFYGPLSYYINKNLSVIPLSPNLSWVNNVVKEMGQDKRLIKQNPVIETDR